MCLAVPMQVVELLPNRFALADAGGVRMEVSLHLVEDVAVGDHLIVHAGFAIEKLDAQAAAQTLKLLEQAAQAEAREGGP